MRNNFLNVILSEDIHIYTCDELFSECTTLWGHTYIYMWGTIFWMYYSFRTYIYLHVRKYYLNVLLSEDIHIFTCEELLSECTTVWGHTCIYMWGTIFWLYYSLRTYIYLHVRNYFLNVLLTKDIHIFTCKELFSECTTLWGQTYAYMWGTIFWIYYSLRTCIYLYTRNYCLSVLISETIQVFTCEELFSECTTLWDMHIFTCEELFSECTTLWGDTCIYLWGNIFWVYYSLRTYIYLHARNYCLSALISENILVFTCEELFSGFTTLWEIHIFTCEELFSECTTLWGNTCIYMWGTNFWVYYSLRTYIYLHVRNYFPNVLLSEDIHIFTCEELFSECTTLWGYTYIYI